VPPRSEREHISDEGRCQEKIVLLRARRVKHHHLKVNYPSPRDILWSKDINELIDSVLGYQGRKGGGDYFLLRYLEERDL